MFQEFYQMSHAPFSRDIACNDICHHDQFEEASSRLLYAAREHGFAVLTGPCGTGKTTLLRSVCEILTKDRYKVIYISDSALAPAGFYRGALASLGMTPRRSCSDAKRQFADALKNLPAYSGMQPVFVLDESHLFSLQMLEEVRFILNTEFDSHSPAALILCGQDELADKLKLASMTAIRQRIDLVCSLRPLTRAETQGYIEHHLKCAGTSSPLFTDRAIDAVHEFSGGIPRLIDKVCTNLLIFGAQQTKRTLDDHDAKLVFENEFLS